MITLRISVPAPSFLTRLGDFCEYSGYNSFPWRAGILLKEVRNIFNDYYDDY